MKVGICTSLENAPVAVDAGFDYVELSASRMMANPPWNTSLDPFDASPYRALPVEVCNLFFPGDAKLFSTDWQEIFPVIVYLGLAQKRLAEAGIEVAVIGSGNQRRCPPEVKFPYRDDPLIYKHADSESPEEIIARWLADFSQPPEPVKFAPESLERSETNVGTGCASFSRILKKHGIGYTADAYHLLREWEADGREGGLDAPSVAFWADQLPHCPTHLHLAQLEGRRFPQPKDPMLEGFFARVFELGYNDRVSLECSNLNSDDYRQAMENVRSYFG